MALNRKALMNRSDVGRLSDFELQLTATLIRTKLCREWQRGSPGRVEDIYDLALLVSDAQMRGIPTARYENPAQLRLFDPEET